MGISSLRPGAGSKLFLFAFVIASIIIIKIFIFIFIIDASLDWAKAIIQT